MGPSSQQWPMVNHRWEGVVNQLKPFDHLDTIDGMFVFKEADDIHGTTQTTKIYADVFVKYGGPDIYYYMHYNKYGI